MSAVDLSEIRKAVNDALERHLSSLESKVTGISAEATEILRPTRTLLMGGKRLRSAFCLLSYRCEAGTQDIFDSTMLDVCCALELFHGAALVHDDIIDDSARRRGEPSAHVVLSQSHDTSSGLGDSGRFGTSAAMLLGDLLLVESDSIFDQATDSMPDKLQARSIFDRMREEVTVGQYLDVLAESRPLDEDINMQIDRAWTVLRAKSAGYSVVGPLLLGAQLAGASDERIDAWKRFGNPVGEAFQLRDDLLGVFGDPAATGKPAGDDIREGKRTLLIVHTLSNTTPQGIRTLTDALGNPAITDAQVNEVRKIITDSGSVEYVENLIRSLIDDAHAALDALRLSDSDHAAFMEITDEAAHRTA